MEVKIFVSYSHKDRAWLDDLVGYLTKLQPEGVRFWWDEDIVAGDDWNEEIKARIKESHIALLLISQAYLDSKYVANEEVADFLKQRQRERLILFPILLSDCKWQEHDWLKRLQLAAEGRTLGHQTADPNPLFPEIRQDLEKQIQKIREAIRMPQNVEASRNSVYNEKAIIFVHDETVSWGDFPRFLIDDRALDSWNVFSFKYSSRIRLWDLVAESNRPLKLTAQMLRTACSVPPLGTHKKFALIAHSIAGLIVQLAILESEDFTGRVSHFIMFGTPSAGLPASVVRFLMKNLNLNPDGKFIEDLRQRWNDKFKSGRELPFPLLTIAGESDEIVPSFSSLDPFPESQRQVVPGDHFEIIQPSSKNDPSVQIVIDKLRTHDQQNLTQPVGS